MTGEWQEVTVAGVASAERNALVGGPFGSDLVSRDYVDHGTPVIRGQNMGGRWVGGDFVFVSPAKAASLVANLARAGDIVFTQRGTLGQVSLVPDAPFDRYLVSQSQMKLTVDRELADPLFLYYVFRDIEQQDYIRRNSIQTGVPHTNLGILRATPIPLPPLPEQRAIAQILGALDDKIELNRRTNETLEAIARALFKSWFVDFDPVRAKSEGRDPGLPPHLADLFPDSFEDSELGEAPQGWRVGTLSELSQKPQYGYTASADEDPVGPKFLRITDINKDPWINWSSVPNCVISEAEFERYRMRIGDILIARMADPGHGVMIEEDIESVFASYLIRFRPIDNAYARFLQYWIRSDGYWALVNARRTGTTRASLNAQVLGAFQLAIPPPALAQAFGARVAVLRFRVVANVAQSEALASSRDTLLPKLISGELRLRDAERLVEGVSA
jgi:type I restriction enzyme S subunit